MMCIRSRFRKEKRIFVKSSFLFFLFIKGIIYSQQDL
ncbi:hypothetical protein CLNEO_29680 [Anaerotignum neopropionicum]|uniref:Uncharacterized protein n=1 Tax=Anaerotignum neopropionicum TaxID=36847 RepID=A0A136WAW1_9FIRM|nr:hypothetical protein CLNEO_29680 [Anaerotignum neopropionicum]